MAFKTAKRIDENEIGFGKRSYSNQRFLNRDGTVNVKRKGNRLRDNIDFYHTLITMSWSRFLLLVVLSYFCVNTVFAVLYYLVGKESFGNLQHMSDLQDFIDLYFFSAQTITTVGYGYIYPVGFVASALAATESMIGLLGFALATGVLYGRFSRPKADIVYSKDMVVAPYRGITGLMLRLANSKQNELIEVEAKVIIAMTSKETKGRVFLPLTLELQKIQFLPLNWTIVHPIDEQSPIYGFSYDDLVESDVEVIISIKAINDTYSQTVYSRISYKAHEIVYGAKFKAMMNESDEKGSVIMNLDQIHDYERVELV
jgi:inward rectifier potassium channel